MEGVNLPDKVDETGWDRLKALFKLDEDYFPAEEVEHIPTVVCISSIYGFLVGGRFGGRIGGQFYERHNKIKVYRCAMDYHREMHSAKVVGYVKYGCRWGWRMGVLAGLYSFMVAGSTAYRNKDDALNYIAAGAATGAIYKSFSGWRSMVVGTVICAGVSVPLGLLVQAVTPLIPKEPKETSQEKKNLKEQLWKEKLQVTENYIKGMESALLEEVEEVKPIAQEHTEGKLVGDVKLAADLKLVQN